MSLGNEETSQASNLCLAGFDGCKGGWIAAIADQRLTLCSVQVFKRFSDILREHSSLQVVGVDIPIGLLDKEPGERACDKAARAVLGARRSSVFPAPRRFWMAEKDYPFANLLSKTWVKKGISRQSLNIADKVGEVDTFVQKHGQARVREVHPEVSFWAMNGEKALAFNKKKQKGKEERASLLRTHLGDQFIQSAEGQAPKRAEAGIDDLYDALAALWSAQRILSGDSRRLPSEPIEDACGLLMEINY